MRIKRLLCIALTASMVLGMTVHAEESVVETEVIVEESVLETEVVAEESVVETEAIAEETIVETQAALETEAIIEETIIEIPETELVEELEDAKQYTGVEAFVVRLYNVCLNRQPDASGLADWTKQLENKEICGVDAAYGFVFSPEFIGHNLCNSDFVEQLYQAFMGRKSDAAGKADWVGKLSRGVTREEVFNGFALSMEFANLCNSYGIEIGTPVAIPVQGTQPNGKCKICGKTEAALDGVTGFVQRLYSICLNRNADESGLADWTTRLRTRAITGRDAAYGFFFSPEFINKKYNNSTYVEYLYKALMGRASDAAGKADWLNRLAKGWTREMVFDGFAGSQEFTNICDSYGIIRDDSLIPSILGTYEISVDLRDELIKEMDESMKDEGIDISFGDYMHGFTYGIILEFKSNGTYKRYADTESLESCLFNLKSALKLYMRDAFFEILKDEINSLDPTARIRNQADLENYFGMTFDQILYEALGMNLETYVELIMEDISVASLAKDIKAEGKYKAQKGKLHMSASLNTNYSESAYETYVVQGNVVTITGGVNIDESQNGGLEYPFTMIKIGN